MEKLGCQEFRRNALKSNKLVRPRGFEPLTFCSGGIAARKIIDLHRYPLLLGSARFQELRQRAEQP